MNKKLLLFCISLILIESFGSHLLGDDAGQKKLVLVAGRPSHPPRMHEHSAGMQLLDQCLKQQNLISSQVVLGGWPEDESIFDDADAVVFFMDGGRGHEVVKRRGSRLERIERLVANGKGVGFMHFAVEVVPEQAGDHLKRWIGGHYEHELSCNPIWTAKFDSLPEHPITRGVQPFSIQDEWYFNMRFVGDISGNQPAQTEDLRFVPILIASPSDAVRDGPYVYPQGPYPHIQANKGRAETLLWTVERKDGGRGFGFTGGHFHDNWADQNFRKIMLNSFLWLAQVDVPERGVESKVTPEMLNANLDKK